MPSMMKLACVSLFTLALATQPILAQDTGGNPAGTSGGSTASPANPSGPKAGPANGRHTHTGHHHKSSGKGSGSGTNQQTPSSPQGSASPAHMNSSG